MNDPDPYPELCRWWYTRRNNGFYIYTDALPKKFVLKLVLEESQLWIDLWERPGCMTHDEWLAFKTWWSGAEWLPLDKVKVDDEETLPKQIGLFDSTNEDNWNEETPN